MRNGEAIIKRSEQQPGHAWLYMSGHPDTDCPDVESAVMTAAERQAWIVRLSGEPHPMWALFLARAGYDRHGWLPVRKG